MFSFLWESNEIGIIGIPVLKQYKSAATTINHKHVSNSTYMKNLTHFFPNLKILKHPKILLILNNK